MAKTEKGRHPELSVTRSCHTRPLHARATPRQMPPDAAAIFGRRLLHPDIVVHVFNSWRPPRLLAEGRPLLLWYHHHPTGDAASRTSQKCVSTFLGESPPPALPALLAQLVSKGGGVWPTAMVAPEGTGQFCFCISFLHHSRSSSRLSPLAGVKKFSQKKFTLLICSI